MTTVNLGPPTVRFARRSTRGFLLGFSGLRCGVILLAALILLTGLLTGGGVGLIATGPLWSGLLATAFVPVRGRVVVEWLPTVLQWQLRRVTRQTTYRVRVSPPRPV
ncbi:MAG: SCO6880 family protein, partial [Acidimicrobiales bacterium]